MQIEKNKSASADLGFAWPDATCRNHVLVEPKEICLAAGLAVETGNIRPVEHVIQTSIALLKRHHIGANARRTRGRLGPPSMTLFVPFEPVVGAAHEKLVADSVPEIVTAPGVVAVTFTSPPA